jgi:hypothetical protein
LDYLFEISPANLFIFLVEKGVFWVGVTTARAVEVLALRPGGRADAIRALITRENT